jgi:threonyl-tRNA synthetase
MNDAHIYCNKEQFADEFRAVNEMYLKYFKIFGIDKYVMRLSLHEPSKRGQKYIDEPELWEQTESMVRETLIASNIPFIEVQDEAAFYGPKIDVQIWSAIGREFTLATNQVDFNSGNKFKLTYTTKDNSTDVPLIIHRAPLGTHERFIGFLLEHFAGKFPTWLAPLQVKILPISDKFMPYAVSVLDALKKAGKVAVGKKETFINPDKCYVFLVDPNDKQVKHCLAPGAAQRIDIKTEQTYVDFEVKLKGLIALWVEVY